MLLESAGLFDVSHLARIELKGENAIPFINKLITTDFEKLNKATVNIRFFVMRMAGLLMTFYYIKDLMALSFSVLMQ